MQYDVLTDFHLGRSCNFDCSYCYYQGPDRRNPACRGQPKDRIVAGFNGTGLTWFIHITGGEPFLHPEFVELCAELSRRHYLGVNTNLSTPNVAEFAAAVSPGRLGYVHCSYRFEARQDEGARKAFIEKARLLRSKGFPVHVTQVVYPSVVRVFPRLFEPLRKEGILLRSKVLKGLYRFRSYPSGYTRAERELILKYIGPCKEEAADGGFFDSFFFREDEFVAADLSFTGRPCRAGSAFVVVRPNGEVVRCLDVHEKLGNLFDGSAKLHGEARPCAAAACSSARFGLNFCDGPPAPVVVYPLRAVAAQLVRNGRLAMRRWRAAT